MIFTGLSLSLKSAIAFFRVAADISPYTNELGIFSIFRNADNILAWSNEQAKTIVGFPCVFNSFNLFKITELRDLFAAI